MNNTTITKTVFFAANRETVWAFLTEKDKLALWFHPATADLAAGEEFSLVEKGSVVGADPVCWGTVLEMQRPSRLVYSFTIKPLGGGMTTVTWTLEDASGGTRLTLLHEGIAEAAGEAALGLLLPLDAGWDKHFVALREAVKAS